MLEEQLKGTIRDVIDFPKEGIVFKDITPLLQDAELCRAIIDEFEKELKGVEFDVIAGIESRGFLFGMLLAQRLQKPFIPIRKKGRLPYTTVAESYDLEYGSATIEIHADSIQKGQKILIHDDLLATGGTVRAASRLIEKVGGTVAGYCFVISLDFLNGQNKFSDFSSNVVSLVRYL